MRRVSTIQYKALTAPVLTTAQFKETVTESRWHQPLTEPVRLKTLPLAVIVASGLYQPVLTTAQFKETVTESRWHQPLTEPVRLKTLPLAVIASGGASAPVLTTAQFKETVTESRWHQPLSDPVRRGGLPTAVTAPATFDFYAVLPAPLAGWHRALSEPVRRRQAYDPSALSHFGYSYAQPLPPILWQQGAIVPPPARFRLENLTLSVSYVYFDAPTVDRWLQPFAQPLRRVAPNVAVPPQVPAFTGASPPPPPPPPGTAPQDVGFYVNLGRMMNR